MTIVYRFLKEASKKHAQNLCRSPSTVPYNTFKCPPILQWSLRKCENMYKTAVQVWDTKAAHARATCS